MVAMTTKLILGVLDYSKPPRPHRMSMYYCKYSKEGVYIYLAKSALFPARSCLVILFQVLFCFQKEVCIRY